MVHVAGSGLNGDVPPFVLLPQRPADFKTPELFNILWALAKLRHYPSGQFNQFVEYAVGRLGALRPADMATLFYACGMLGHHPGKVATAKLLPRLQVRWLRCLLAVSSLYAPKHSPAEGIAAAIPKNSIMSPHVA